MKLRVLIKFLFCYYSRVQFKFINAINQYIRKELMDYISVQYKTIEGQYFPNQQMSSLTTTFNNTSYYFTTAQARQLIQLVSYESNRLQLAKLSYRTITDRNNFSQLYDILSSQASRNELDSYVKAYTN